MSRWVGVGRGGTSTTGADMGCPGIMGGSRGQVARGRILTLNSSAACSAVAAHPSGGGGLWGENLISRHEKSITNLLIFHIYNLHFWLFILNSE